MEPSVRPYEKFDTRGVVAPAVGMSPTYSRARLAPSGGTARLHSFGPVGLRAKRSLEKAAEEIVWQVEVEAWRTLGYRSWTAMREAEYGEAAFMVPAKQRPELVARMRATGLTQQEIADTAGVHHSTVQEDLKSVNADIRNEPESITNARGQLGLQLGLQLGHPPQRPVQICQMHTTEALRRTPVAAR